LEFSLLEAISMTHRCLTSEQKRINFTNIQLNKGSFPKGFPKAQQQKKNFNSAEE
jgi:hypothetical protein